jgi:predicted ArsR family transcriptional regulator
MKILVGSLEERILRLLLAKYSLSLAKLQKKLKVRPETLTKTLHLLEKNGFIVFDNPPEGTLVRIIRKDFEFFGRQPTQKKAFKHSRRKEKEEFPYGYV